MRSTVRQQRLIAMATREADRWRHNPIRIPWRDMLVVSVAVWLIFIRPLGAQSRNEQPEGKPSLQVISYGLIGTVKSDGRPISGATIRAVHGALVLTTLTDETGSFVLGGMTPGTWEISVTMFGFETAHQDVQIENTS